MLAVIFAPSACGFAEPALQPLTPESLTRVAIPPVNGKTAAFDIIAVDQDHHRLFISDALDQGVDVVDIATSPGVFLQTIHLGAIPSGMTFVPELHRLFTGNDDSTVAVIDVDPASPHVGTVLEKIGTNGQGTADLLDYDARDHKLYVTNPDDGFLSSIDVTTGAVKKIPNLGTLQQPRYDPADGMVYVLNTDRDSIIEIDPSSDAVVAEYTLPVVCVPHGLAINPATNQGLIGCSDRDNQIAIAYDFKSKRALSTTDLAGAGDAVIFDAQAQHFYFAAPNFNPPELAVFSAAPITFLTAVPTSHRSKSVGYDEAHQLIYTFDGKHLEASLWVFPDPVAGCSGAEAQRAAAGAPRGQTPHCHPPIAVSGH